MKQYIKLDQIIYSKSEISEETMEEFIDKFLDLVESYDFTTGGGYGLYTEKEILEEEE